MNFKHIAAVAVGATLLSSCIKNDDFDPSKVSKVDNGIEINLPFPLGTANFAFADLTKDFDGLNESFNQNMTVGKIALSGTPSQLTSPLGTAVNSFPSPNDTLVGNADGKTVPFFPALSNLNLGTQSEVVLNGFTSAKFSKGTIEVKVTNNWGFNVTNLQINVANSANGNVETLTYASIPNGGSSSQTLQLTGKTLGNKITPSIPTVSAPAQTNVAVNLANNLVIDITPANLEIESGKADIPAQAIKDSVSKAITIENNGNAIDVNSLDVASGHLIVNIDKYQFGSNSDIEVTIPEITDASNNPLVIKLDNLSGTRIDSTDLANHKITLGAGNTVKANVVANIKAKANGDFNATDEVNAKIDISNLKFGNLSLKPTTGTISAASFKDTLAFDVGEGLDDIKSLTMVLTVENTFPIDSVKLDYLDANGAILDNFATFGNLLNPAPQTIEIEFTGDKLKQLKKAKNIAVIGAVTNGTATDIKIEAADFFKFIVGIKASVKLSN